MLRFRTILISSLILFAVVMNTSAQSGLEDDVREDITKALVQIQIVNADDNSLNKSGVIISPSGFVFTTLDDFPKGDHVIRIATFDGPNKPPRARYRASVVFQSDTLNLAILQIDADLQGQVIFSDQLKLDYIFRWQRDVEPSPGNQIYTLAYSESGDLNIEDGSVVSKAEDDNLSEGLLDSNYINDGNRGGVVILPTGEVIGLVTGVKINAVSGGGRANFTSFLPIKKVCSDLQKICDNLFVSVAPMARTTKQAAVCLPKYTHVTVREKASQSSSRVDLVNLGDHVLLLDTPTVNSEGLVWVQIQTVSGSRGWVPDIFNRTRMLLSYQSDGNIDQNYPIEAGKRAFICVTFPQKNFSVRADPSGRILKRLVSGEIVSVVSGPVSDKGSDWWQITDSKQEAGWVPESDGDNRVLIGLP